MMKMLAAMMLINNEFRDGDHDGRGGEEGHCDDGDDDGDDDIGDGNDNDGYCDDSPS